MQVKLLLVNLMIVGASALSGASAQNAAKENEDLMELVRIIRDNTTDDYIPAFRQSDDDEANLIGVLDCVEDIYEANDFYESGFWGKDGNTFRSDIYTGRLPEYTDDDFIRPVLGGSLTSLFGYRERYHRMHKGIDISLKEGDVVRAALPGVVARIDYEPGGYGHFVVLVHSNGVETRYAHLNRVTAALGQSVHAGDAIALGGNSGNSTGPHLHFEIRKQGKAIDPLLVFSF